MPVTLRKEPTMPEYPEIRHLSNQMHEALSGKTIIGAEIANEKCLNMPSGEFTAAIAGRSIEGAGWKGKWAFLRLDNAARLALNLNMGGNVALHGPGEPPREKWRIHLKFSDGCSLSIGFWFLGYLHLIAQGQPHPMTDSLGADPLSSAFSFEQFDALLGARKAPLKSLLLRQDLIAGIGNYYIQDMLFLARVHPMRPTLSLSVGERLRVYEALRATLKKALDLGGAWYESGLDGQPGGFKEMLIGYREGKPCPACGTIIKKIKTGSTSGYVCEKCQPLVVRDP
jgi:formamidopyrimidine-DNA glycosylase